jgi:hypothetical protein
VLFTILIDHLLWSCYFVGGIQLIERRTVFDGDFADDIALLSHLREDLQQNITELWNKVGRVGLPTSTQKTKIMRNNVNTTPARPLNVGSDELDEVTDFKYLGRLIKSNRSLEPELFVQAMLIPNK